MSLPRHGSYEHHRSEAERLYGQYRTALAKVDAHELAILGRQGGNPAKTAYELSDAKVPRDWYYKALVGAKNGLLQQLEIEIGMTAMYREGS